ncbi:MAG: PhoPQ-activated pathogenicity-related family protein [Gemmataceae bacterium]|nr:PhoPQ-activated pathogenicity-related family protein [Gemmataceae bacterium]
MPARGLLAIAVLTVPTVARADQPTPPPPTDLTDYVSKADPSFAWKLAGKNESDAGTAYLIDLTSQTWHDIAWTHKLQIFLPKGAKPTATVVLWNQGNRPRPESEFLGLTIAAKVGAPVCFLYGVPNQPLFGGKTEDALIAETFVRYLETKDGSWPLLFPMVKSVVRAMDAVQAFAKEEWKHEVTGFVVTGASKRGWTSWLTAATGDKRVKAIAPLVIDTLNMPVQMKNQVRAFGKPSLEIKDYTDRGLVPIPDTPEARKLWTMIDPYVYRDRVTVPKMIINGANDPYWPLDALNSYWDELKGEKYVLYVPNAGHDLRETDPTGKKQLIPERAVNTLSAFCKCVIFDKPMPKMTWKFGDQRLVCAVAAMPDAKPAAARLWAAGAPTRDFRPARWVSKPATVSEDEGQVYAVGIAVKPEEGFGAVLAELDFKLDDLTFPLSTQIRILEAPK